MSSELITADGQYCETKLNISDADLVLGGNFNGATVAVEVLNDFGTWVEFATYTDIFAGVIDFHRAGRMVRLNVSGATGASIEAEITA